VNKSFTASGRLDVTLTRGWEQHLVLSQRDTGRSTLEDQLLALIRVLDIDKAEAEWASEEQRPADVRKERLTRRFRTALPPIVQDEVNQLADGW
jgi:hypothetical protein